MKVIYVCHRCDKGINSKVVTEVPPKCLMQYYKGGLRYYHPACFKAKCAELAKLFS